MPRRRKSSTDKEPNTPPLPDPAQDREPAENRSLAPRDLISNVRTFFDTLGIPGVCGMLETLNSPPDSEEARLLSLLRDPAWASVPLHLTARRAGISLTRLKEVFVTHQFTEGTLRMYQHVPKIMEDTAIAATERDEACVQCKGIGHATVEMDGDMVDVPCSTCGGDGTVRLSPDPAARALMFDRIWPSKSGGPLVAIQQNFTSAPQFEDLMRESSRVIDVTPGKEG